MSSPERRAQRLLIVDDEGVSRLLLGALFRDECELMEAGDGRTALAAAAAAGAAPPDLILLDILLPDMDGREVCRRLKEDAATQDIPVIFVSAVADEAEQARAFELGAVDYIVKPFHRDIVRARVRLHLRLKRQSDLLERLAALDALTEIGNRRAFEQNFDTALAQGDRAPLALAMIDVDLFKQYNDSLGHAAGDECLRRVAAALAAAAGVLGGSVARYGGEEFACILPGINADTAAGAAERLRTAVLDLGLPHPHGLPGALLSASVGIATCAAPAPAYRARLLATADAALYRAKQLGRNRVEVADAAVAQG
ncbi:diguanylate cyclase domain-containing protein [Thiohalocapsa sp. ML1]|uniref:GGDEF domain-containing response regulator n=1 Tax=Thiohalocapsa sp. ML1 TaxID=1431688 RepID=UPI0007323803|nr:diguanylate cyclase [Thiohalocapsa sp. ML1]